MKLWNRIISFVLVLAMVLSMVPQAAPHVHAEELDHEGHTHGEQSQEAPASETTEDIDLFVFAGQSNMMGASVLEPTTNSFTHKALEYKYLPKLRGQETGSFVPAGHPAGEWHYKDLIAAYGENLTDLSYHSNLANYSANTHFCPAMRDEVKGFSGQSEANTYPGASLAPYFVTEYAEYGHSSVYAHMAKGAVKIIHYFTEEMMTRYNTLISEYNTQNNKSYATLTPANLTGAGDAFDDKYNSMLEDYAAYVPGNTVKNKCFVWLQGEGDAGYSYIEYKLKLKVLWEHLQELGFTHFFVLRVGYWGSTGILNVIKAQEDFCAENENCYMVTRAPSLIPYPGATTDNWWINEPSTEYENCRDSYLADSGNHHFNEKAMQIFAERSAWNVHRILHLGLDPILEEENIQGMLTTEEPDSDQPEDSTPYTSYIGTETFCNGLSVSKNSDGWEERSSSTAASTDLIPVKSTDSVWHQYVFFLSEAHAVGGFYDKDGKLVAPLYYKDFGFSLGGGSGEAAFRTPGTTNRVSIADVEAATGKEIAYVRFTAWQASAGGHHNTEARIYHEECDHTYENGICTICGEIQAVTALTWDQAVAELRARLVARESSITLTVTHDHALAQEELWDMLDEAMTHTGNPKEGDYILANYHGCSYSVSTEYVDGQFLSTCTFSPLWLATAEQEAEVDAAVDALLAELDLWDATEYEKIKGAYDWITENVQYDFDNYDDPTYLLKHSTYAALIQRVAVCQGYASLYYRLLLELGVDCRYISGISDNERHGWNIVRLEGKYYNCDPTWDRDLMGHYRYFLCTEANFGDHERDTRYDTEEFHAQYPMAVAPYVFNVAASGKIREGLEWVLDGDTGILTVAGTGAIPSYRYSTAPWYPYRESVRGIVVTEGITEVGERAFYWCTNCTSVTLPESLIAIREYGFNNLRALQSITLPSNLKTLEFCAFSECAALTSITLPDSVTTVGSSVFSNCPNLFSATLSAGMTTIPSSMFFNDGKLMYVTIPEGITYIDDTAFHSTNLWKVHLPASLTGMGSSVFAGCKGLKEFTVAEGNTAYKAVNGVLFTANGKTLICYPAGKSGNYTVPEGTEYIATSAFRSCNYLYSITFCSTLKEIGDYSFSYCQNLTSITLPKNVTRVCDSAFRSCTSLRYITFQNDSVILESGGVFAECDSLTSITLPAKLTEIPGYLFYGCALLDNVVIPSTATKIGSSAFLDCDSLTSITIPGNVKSIGRQAFDFCNRLRTIEIQEGCTTIEDYCIRNAPALTYVYLPDSLASIGREMFDECPKVVLYVNCGTYGESFAISKGLNRSVSHPYTVSRVVEPTCTTQGYTVMSCKCGTYSYNTNYVSAYGHDYTWEVTDPTCTSDGYTTYICTRCGYWFEDDWVPALGHDTVLLNYVPATCTTDGYSGDEYCETCGQTVTIGQKIPATGHSYGETVRENESVHGSYDEVTYCSICSVELSRERVYCEPYEASGAIVIEDFPTLPYDVFRSMDGTYFTENIYASFDEEFTEFFIDTVNGSDTNAGTSRDAAFKTLKQALTAAYGKAFIITIINADAVLYSDGLYGEYVLKETGAIRAESTAMLLGGLENPGFTLADGCSNTYISADLSNYSIQASNGVSAVVDVDNRNLDEMGLFAALTPVTSVAQVETTDGSYYYDTNAARMYVNPRYSIETIHPLLATHPLRFNLLKAEDDTTLYLENLNVIGGFFMSCRSAADETDTRNLQFVAKECTFQHNFRNNAVSVSNFNLSYMIDCRVGYSLQDGYNYHAVSLTTEQRIDALHVEVNCQAEECGYYRMMFGVGDVNNNLSTAHEGINILRVNFTGHNSYGPLIADVNGSHSVNIDCVISNDDRYDGGTVCYQASQNSTSIRNGKMVLINCYAYDTRPGVNLLSSSAAETVVLGGNVLDKYSVVGELTVLTECTHSYENAYQLATCTNNGYSLKICELCGDKRVTEIFPTEVHCYGAWTVAKAATCTEVGQERRECINCNYYETRTVEATGHDYKSVVTAPTCTERGYTTHTCTKCGHSYTDSYVNAIGHKFGNWTVVKAATCTEDGTERRDCQNCDHYETRVIEATGHDYKSVITEPTCTEQGYTTHTCANCGHSYVDSYVDATGHKFGNWYVTKEATCTEDGSERRDCDNCDHYETRTITATGHDYKSVVTAPTCTEQGYTTHTCANCGHSYVDSYVNPTGHKFSNWTVTKAATCTEDGTERRDCANCNHYESRTIEATGHNYKSVVTAPTCTEQGYTTHTCTVCGDSYVDSYVNPTGHKFGNWVVTKNATCTEDGQERRDCQNCDHYETRVIEATGHDYKSVVTAPTCTEQGYTTHTCTVCGHNYVDSYVNPTGHKFGNWYVTKAATCTEDCTERRDCQNCDHYETRTVEATGHDYKSVVTAPTCTEQGYTTHTCTKCGDKYVDTYVLALGHHFVNYVSDGNASCTEDGTKTAKCERCDATDTVVDRGSATGHKFGNWYVTKEATCTEDGTERRDCQNCNHYETRTIEATGHNYKSVVTAPTCTEKGYTTHTCTVCGDSYVDSYVNPTGHKFGNWVVTKEATCTEDGQERRDCANCDYYETRTITATGHNYKSVVTAPTCTEQGYTTHTCTLCGDSYVDSYVDATGHKFGNWYVTKAATCEEEGIERRDCANCDHYETRTIKATGHDYKSVVTPPTCTEQGYTTHTCSKCEHSYVDSYVNPTGHKFSNWTVVKAATCTEDGTERRDCQNCDHYETRVIEATGHDYKSVVTAPTCTERGYTIHTCSICGDSYVDTYVPALGHSYGEWYQTKAPTYESEGEERRDCTRCDHYQTRVIPMLKHEYVSVVTEPTCTEQGYTTHTCTKCGDTYVDTFVPALGHNFVTYVSDGNATCTEDGTKTAKCERCDAIDTVVDRGSATGHKFGNWTVVKAATCTEDGTERRDCQNCDHYETRTIEATGHNYKSVVTAPTCTEQGYTTHTCTKCGDSYVDSYVNPTGHKFGNWTVTKEATCTENGQERRDCDNCDHYETRTIKATGHNYKSVVTAPTCTEQGYTTHTCTACGDSYVDTYVPALGHSYGEWYQT
ncbi:MAG: leucine-rich repeat protein, partial [Oscillospiraceae bacterium]|nr:leucine-rich repeat protein [Oscillospiraceae bacterium]